MKAKDYAEAFRKKCEVGSTLDEKVSVLVDLLFDMHQEAIDLAKKRGVRKDSGLFACLREVVQKMESMFSVLEKDYRLSELHQTPKELYLALLKKFYPDIYPEIERKMS